MTMLKTHDDTAIGDTMEDAIGVVIENALLVPESAAMMQVEKDAQVQNVFVNSLKFTSNDASPVPPRREPPFF